MRLYDTMDTGDTMSTMSTANVGDTGNTGDVVGARDTADIMNTTDVGDVVEFGRLWCGLQRNTLSRSGGKFSDFNFTMFLGDTGIFLYSSDHRG